MLWFLLWTFLVLGALAVLAWAGLTVYRSARDLLEELGRASAVAGEVSARLEELTAAAEALHPVRPVDLRDPAPARARRAEARVLQARRRAARAERHEATYRRWRSFSR
ncbi:hypothetical protein [Cellulomonas bogoriensis]|uniref:Histidine kinase n=1 Tax=Cellulomonas bogoriensis 69B4 = DSM 16987 TaxID=1386082 RepID=A0A0A0BRV1_9CELL|nr:hypothetical protein [Cellulomonas bogoriensis]KGM09854.1 hypothetical protein N869_04625 [Cellulomonas bogoriensis 69B4 = DSM 16987]